MRFEKYVTRSRLVNAVRLTPGNVRVAADWVRDNGGEAEVVPIGSIVDGVIGLRISTSWCSVIVYPGDWVVEHENEPGRFEVLRDVDFQQRFIKPSEDRPDPRVTDYWGDDDESA